MAELHGAARQRIAEDTFTMRRPATEHQYFSKTPEEWSMMNSGLKKLYTHLGNIEETTLGEIDSSNPCEGCVSRGQVCKRYTEVAQDLLAILHPMASVDQCARCRHRRSGPCVPHNEGLKPRTNAKDIPIRSDLSSLQDVDVDEPSSDDSSPLKTRLNKAKRKWQDDTQQTKANISKPERANSAPQSAMSSISRPESKPASEHHRKSMSRPTAQTGDYMRNQTVISDSQSEVIRARDAMTEYRDTRHRSTPADESTKVLPESRFGQFHELGEWNSQDSSHVRKKTAQWLHEMRDIVVSMHDIARLQLDNIERFDIVQKQYFSSLTMQESNLYTRIDELEKDLSGRLDILSQKVQELHDKSYMKEPVLSSRSAYSWR